ncbi:hypothetical protein QP167_08275 [Corynebacterium amycolatum]|uniref:hypothetical protein n=1 Tax=Corynebacterium amycolatum TaxID=43765 RepID=UPI001245CC71|nr:hypothetical protein [Corynebacterium amycolatum]KAA9246329.1 hypothetical protein F6I30_03725 [Corynebacterium amycolatum]MDK6476423.1 hypothetical protein [Corynebacterium amycolatum]
MGDWQKEMTAKIGSEVQRLRGDRSLLWLETRTAELGHKVARSGLSQLENGNRKSISVAEWLVLAAALNTAPILLLFPAYPDGIVEYLPGLEDRAIRAGSWVEGTSTFVAESGEINYFENQLVKAAQERENTLYKALKMMEEHGDFEESLTWFKRAVQRLEQTIKSLGGSVAEKE